MPRSNNCQLWTICMNAGISGFVVGYNIVVFNLCQLNVAYTLNWGDNTNLFISLFTSILLVGALLSSPVAGSLSNIVGRKNTLLLGNLVGFAGSFITVVPYTLFFGLGRFLSGVAVGFFTTVTPVYISEMTSVKLAGKLGSLFVLLLSIGIFGGLAMGLVLPEEAGETRNNWWLFMFALPGFIMITQTMIVLLWYNFDTPHWLNMKGHHRLAKLLLKELGRGDESLEEGESASKATYGELLCTCKYSKPMRVGMSAIASLPVSGVNLFGFYSTYIFSGIGFDMFYARLYSTFLGISELVGLLILLNIVHKIGRKVLLVGGIAVNVCLFVFMIIFLEAVELPLVVVALAISFKLSYSLSTGSMSFIVLSEVLEPRGVGMGSSLMWILNVIVGTTGIYALETLTISGTFAVYMFLSLLLGIHLYFDMVETKDKSKEEIQSLYLKIVEAQELGLKRKTIDDSGLSPS